jgi:putative colanic acid biosynthesis UDP-glucose lipid carrier transferase
MLPRPYGFLRLYGRDLSRLQRLADPLVVAGLFWLVSHFGTSSLSPALRLSVMVGVALLTALILPGSQLYQSYRQLSLWTLLARVTTSWGTVLAGLLALGFVFKLTATFSRLELSLWALIAWLLLLLMHVGGRKLLRLHRIRGGNTRTFVYWGTPFHAVALWNQLEHLPHLGLRMQAWFMPPGAQSLSLPPGMPPAAGGLSELRNWLNRNDVDQIYFSYVAERHLSMTELVRFFGDTCKPVYFLPAWSQPSMRFSVEPLGDRFAISLWGPHDSLLDRHLKRLFDIVVSGAALLLLAPLLLLVALLVALSSPGPVLFLQERYGLDGRSFRIYKFRTMTVTESGHEQGLAQARRDDPRVTPIGRILRRWSLDELPQLWNVLVGNMSLVGPRPHAVAHNEQYRSLIPGYMQRHQFKPGITGLAQVEGWRGETADLESMASRVEADLRYQREWSLELDVKILLRTLFQVRSPNAY